MAQQNRMTSVRSDKKGVSRTNMIASSKAVHQALLVEPMDRMVDVAGNSTIGTRIARLGNPRLQTAQRQAIAIQIGQEQGNRHLQRTVASLGTDETSLTHRLSLGDARITTAEGIEGGQLTEPVAVLARSEFAHFVKRTHRHTEPAQTDATPVSPSRSIGRLTVQRKAPAYYGKVYLPGPEHAGHVYQVRGDKIVERTGKNLVPVAKVNDKGEYFLLGPEGTSATKPSGNLADLTGRITRRVGKKTTTVAATRSSGQFCLTDKEGKECVLTIKGGGVYHTDKGKKAKLVGSVDAQGNYEVYMAGQFQKGSLKALVSGKTKAELSQTKGRTVEKLQIGHNAVTQGTIYFDDGQYTIENGRLFPAGTKKAVGELMVVKKGTGRRIVTESIPYRYANAKGKEQSGDLLSGNFAFNKRAIEGVTGEPGEGSSIKIGKDGWKLRVGTEWKSAKRHKSKYGTGFEISAGGRLKTRLHKLRETGKLKITEGEISLLQAVANVESSGLLSSVNTWDSDVLSFGFKQYTMAGKLQDLIKHVPSAFARYGIKIGGQLTIEGKEVEGIVGVNSASELRGAFWAGRFLKAGLDDDIIVAEVETAKKDIQTSTQKVKPSRSAYLQRPRVEAIIFELDNNRSAYVKPVVNRTLNEAKKAKDLDEDKFVEILAKEMETEYVNKNKNKVNGKNDAEARAKAQSIVNKTSAEFVQRLPEHILLSRALPSLASRQSSRVTCTANRGTMDAKIGSLSNPRFHIAQRRALAAEIGQVQGNRHLQQVVTSIGNDNKSSISGLLFPDWRLPLPSGAQVEVGSTIQREDISKEINKEQKPSNQKQSAVTETHITKNSNVVVNPAIQKVLDDLEVYFAKDKLRVIVTSAVRSRERQLGIIIKKAKEYGLHIKYPSILNATVDDIESWRGAWDELLNVKKFIVNPPKPAICKLAPRKGRTMGVSPHVPPNKAFDLAGASLESIEATVSKYAKEHPGSIGQILQEPKNGCVHVGVK